MRCFWWSCFWWPCFWWCGFRSYFLKTLWCFWWRGFRSSFPSDALSFWWRHLQERFSSGAFSSHAFSLDALSFNINSFALWLVQPEPLWIRLWLWSCTLEQMLSISNWQFLIPCYHQNLKGDFAKHPLFQQSPPFWWWQTQVFKKINCC